MEWVYRRISISFFKFQIYELVAGQIYFVVSTTHFVTFRFHVVFCEIQVVTKKKSICQKEKLMKCHVKIILSLLSKLTHMKLHLVVSDCTH